MQAQQPLAGLPLLPAQDISVTISVAAASDQPADVVIDAKGGVGAGLKALGGAVKANVNGVPVDADFGLPGGEADINIATPAIKKAFKFPLQ